MLPIAIGRANQRQEIMGPMAANIIGGLSSSTAPKPIAVAGNIATLRQVSDGRQI
jgi:hypothetical protein